MRPKLRESWAGPGDGDKLLAQRMLDVGGTLAIRIHVCIVFADLKSLVRQLHAADGLLRRVSQKLGGAVYHDTIWETVGPSPGKADF